jgi:putative hydrolase of the HAD superfamily
MSRMSTVLFDLGNTLRHLDHARVAAVIARHGRPVAASEVAVAEYHGKAAVDATFRARRAGTDAARLPQYFDVILTTLGVADAARPAVAAALRAEDARDTLWCVVRDDTRAVLAELRARGYTLGVVSNADGRAAASLDACGLAPYFAAVIDSHIVGVEKPDPRIFALALEACGARPGEAVFVGDIYEVDVVGARNAGMTGYLLDPLGLYGDVDCERIDSLGSLLTRLPTRSS